MKHIVIDARIIASTTGRYVERLLHHLEQIDTVNRYTILVRSKDLTYWQPTNPNFSLRRADFKNYSFNEQLGLLQLLRSLKPDLVHFCTPEQPVLYRGKKVTTIHDLTLLKTYNPDKNWLMYHFKQLVGQGVFRHVARTSSYILTPTNFTRSEVVSVLGAPKDRVITTHLAAENVVEDYEPFSLPSDTFIMAVGQQSAYKNIVRLAEAHQNLLQSHPSLQLVLVGKIDAAAKRNQRTFKERGYTNIIFAGFVSNAQLNWLYRHTSAYIFPSLSEGFGLPGLEAMLQSAPVASSSATCLPEVYGDAALYFDPTDTLAMAHTIDLLLRDEALRADMITRGLNQAKQYSWRRTAEQTHAAYVNALK